MNKGYTQSQYSDSLRNFNLNQAGLQQAEHNYFIKYANSGYSQFNNIQNQKNNKRASQRINQLQNGPFSKIKTNQNDVLRQLKQQYEILKNLPLDNVLQYNSKPKQNFNSQYSSSYDERSQITSSKKSVNKKYSRDAQILALQKKQLQVVISNSMKKIEELLTNQMELKKTIHEMKLQIQGKGGINAQYELTIREYKKNQKQLNQIIVTLKLQIQRKNGTIKQLGQRIAFLQGQKSRREQIQHNYFEQQKQMDNLIRNQKDKAMNAQMNLKRLQMEFQIFQKDKISQLNRLTRQLSERKEVPHQNLQNIKKLKEQLQTKQLKIQRLSQQIDQTKLLAFNRPASNTQQSNKKILQQLIQQLKSKNQSSNKDSHEALAKILIQKLSNQKDQTLKNQLSTLKMQVNDIKRNSSISQNIFSFNQDGQLKNRIKQLQNKILALRRQKTNYEEEIQLLIKQKNQIVTECESYKKKIKQYKKNQERLLSQIQYLTNIKLDESKVDKYDLKQKLQKIKGPYELQESLIERQLLKPNQSQSYQTQIKLLRRKVDEISFQLLKVTEQKRSTQKFIQQQKQTQISRVISELNRYKGLLQNKQEELIKKTQQLRRQISFKNSQIQQLNNNLIQLNKINQQNSQKSKINYEEILKTEVKRHHIQIQQMNKKIIQLVKTVENFSSKGKYYSQIQKQVIELRRLTRNTKRITQTIDHLWQIKQTEYENLNEIFINIRNQTY